MPKRKIVEVEEFEEQKKRPRKEYTLDFKLKVLAYRKTHSVNDTCTHFKIEERLFYKWQKQEKEDGERIRRGEWLIF